MMHEDRRTHGQKALVWKSGDSNTVLAWRGEVLQHEDEPDDLFDWYNQTPDADGLWVWEGWAYITEGLPEYPHEREMLIGGAFRRLTVAELLCVQTGDNVLMVRPLPVITSEGASS